MLFSLLLSILNIAIGITTRTNRSVKDMLIIQNSTYVLMTEDGKRGRRYIFRNGKYSSDKVLSSYDLALVFKDASIGFKTLALGGSTGIQDAINNWDLKLKGDPSVMIFFAVVMMVALGAIKR
ncbi:MAG: hypothetical protein WC169_06895 [Dehalococcoidia bacterium]|jgi:hypothetical protein